MTEAQEVVEIAPALIQQFAAMVSAIPDFEAGGGDGIIEAILSAKTIEDVDSPWTTKREAPVGRPLFIVGLSKAPSEFEGGLPFYVVIETVSPSSGEVKEYTIGAVPCVAQLVKWWTLDAFPLACTVEEVKSKKNEGRTSKHLIYSAEDTAYLRESMSAKKGK